MDSSPTAQNDKLNDIHKLHKKFKNPSKKFDKLIKNSTNPSKNFKKLINIQKTSKKF